MSAAAVPGRGPADAGGFGLQIGASDGWDGGGPSGCGADPGRTDSSTGGTFPAKGNFSRRQPVRHGQLAVPGDELGKDPLGITLTPSSCRHTISRAKWIFPHGLWVLLASGAYFAGFIHPRPLPPTSTLARLERPPAVSSGPDRAVLFKGNAKNGISGAGAEADRWLASFCGADGLISPGRMKEAAQAAIGDPDPLRSTNYFSLLLKGLTLGNAPAALQAVMENAGPTDSVKYLSLLAHAWGGQDGKAALEALATLRGGHEARAAQRTAISAWAAQDPAAARQWLQERNTTEAAKAGSQDEVDDEALSQGLISGMAHRSVDEALQYLITLEESIQEEQIGLLAEQKLKEGLCAAAQWAEGLAGESLRISALEAVGGQFLRQDPEGAIHWAEQMAARPDGYEAVAAVAGDVAERNPQEAAAWVSRLPAGASQDRAFEEVFGMWTKADPLAASQNLTTMAPGAGRDAAIQAFSRTLARESPADALAWAHVMTDPRERADVQIYIAQRWQRIAPKDAREWITANLPPELQARALAPNKR